MLTIYYRYYQYYRYYRYLCNIDSHSNLRLDSTFDVQVKSALFILIKLNIIFKHCKKLEDSAFVLILLNGLSHRYGIFLVFFVVSSTQMARIFCFLGSKISPRENPRNNTHDVW